jgi:hypothetical protein
MPLMQPLPINVKVQLELTINNFKLANLVCKFLITQQANVLKIPTFVKMQGVGASVEIPAANCGFFTTPIIHGAVLDVRRTLAFLMLSIESGTGKLKTMEKNVHTDDFSLANLAISPPTTAQLENLALKITGKASVKCLRDMVVYANKGLAHFSQKDENPTLEAIADASALMLEAIFVFLYDATGTLRPRLFVAD